MADVPLKASPHGSVPESGSIWRQQLSPLTALLALSISGYTLWDTSLKQSDLRIFVPPVIQYSSPYQNSNFEVIAIPVTFANEGARTAVALSLELAVTDPRTKETKRFYSAELGQWSMERTRNRAYQPFAPMPLAGRSTRTETVLFYPRGEDEKPAQIVREAGLYQFAITVDEAGAAEAGWFDKIWGRKPASVAFGRELRSYDARAFQNGTLAMFAKDWRTSTSAGP
jgi:hypothetical protein